MRSVYFMSPCCAVRTRYREMARSLKCSTDQGVQNELFPHTCLFYISSRRPAWIVMGTGNSRVGLEMCCVSLCQPACVEGALSSCLGFRCCEGHRQMIWRFLVKGMRSCCLILFPCFLFINAAENESTPIQRLLEHFLRQLQR